MRVSIEYKDLEIDYRDAGPWRSYELSATGTTFDELLEDATITEIDQDGGELNCYGLDDAPRDEILKAAIKAIVDAYGERE